MTDFDAQENADQLLPAVQPPPPAVQTPASEEQAPPSAVQAPADQESIDPCGPNGFFNYQHAKCRKMSASYFTPPPTATGRTRHGTHYLSTGSRFDKALRRSPRCTKQMNSYMED